MSADARSDWIRTHLRPAAEAVDHLFTHAHQKDIGCNDPAVVLGLDLGAKVALVDLVAGAGALIRGSGEGHGGVLAGVCRWPQIVALNVHPTRRPRRCHVDERYARSNRCT